MLKEGITDKINYSNTIALKCYKMLCLCNSFSLVLLNHMSNFQKSEVKTKLKKEKLRNTRPDLKDMLHYVEKYILSTNM